jgi:TonB family protein
VQEPCIPAPKRAPSTARLGVIIARSGLDSASVNLRVLLNPCGEVRHAQIAKSSGLPELDEATVRWAQRASFPEVVAAMPGFGGIGVLPLKFEAAD